MYILLLIVHVIVCLFLIIVVLLQSGKAADLAGAFGGMGSQTAFGPRGSATLLSKATTISAVLFMVTSLSLSILATQERGARNVGAGERSEDERAEIGAGSGTGSAVPAVAAGDAAGGNASSRRTQQHQPLRRRLRRRRSSTLNAEVAELADALA